MAHVRCQITVNAKGLLSCATKSVKMLYLEGCVPSFKYSPHVETPLSDNFSTLITLCKNLKIVLGNNFIHGLGILAGVVIGLGYLNIVSEFGFCPSIMATGSLGRAKPTTLLASMSTIGCDRTGNYYIH